MVLAPDIGPALTPFGFADAPLEGVPGSLRIGSGGLLLIQELAQVEKVLLAGGTLAEIGGLPLGDEFLRCHGGGVIGETGIGRTRGALWRRAAGTATRPAEF